MIWGVCRAQASIHPFNSEKTTDPHPVVDCRSFGHGHRSASRVREQPGEKTSQSRWRPVHPGCPNQPRGSEQSGTKKARQCLTFLPAFWNRSRASLETRKFHCKVVIAQRLQDNSLMDRQIIPDVHVDSEKERIYCYDHTCGAITVNPIFLPHSAWPKCSMSKGFQRQRYAAITTEELLQAWQKSAHKQDDSNLLVFPWS